MLIKTGTGNSKHRPNRFKCPNCGEHLSIVKRHFMTQCGNCKKNIKGDDLIEITE